VYRCFDSDEKERVSVEYGADLSSSQFGSGFPTRKIHNWLDADFDYENNLFNLNNIHKSPNSLLRVVDLKKDKISGITLPWMYVGMQFATFCWHVEDLYLHSVNYNHLGSTKTWYVIPGKYKETFDRHVQQHYENSRKKNLLEKIILAVDPLELIQAGIPVFKVNQRPRDFVFTFLKVEVL
jgi:[histone H3]-trimethyl-L-lysine4 demethylase